MSTKNPPQTDIGRFYKQVDDFKTKLVYIFQQFDKKQEITDLNKYHDKLSMLKKANVRMPIDLFYKYVVTVYVDKILIRDDGFFLNKMTDIEHLTKEEQDSYSYNLGNSGSKEAINQQDLFFLSQIRQVWQNLQQNVKDNIWNYIQVICLLAERVVGGNVITVKKGQLKESGQLM
jgi:hypothetical protein